MSEANHTPAPWTARPTGPWDGVECYDLITASGRVIGHVNGPQSGEQEANSRLVSAAPDLLEAVEVILDAANDRLADGLGHELPPAIRAKLEAAVAKAKRGAS